MRLTEQQLGFFETFGFLMFPGLLADRIDEIIDGFEEVWQKNGGGHNGQSHDGLKRSCILPFIDHSARLTSLLDDPRIVGIAASLMGDDFNYLTSDGNYYVGDTSWHSDGYRTNHSYLHVKMGLYLDPLTRDTGCLRVIPGSHRVSDRYADTLQKDIRQSEELWGVHGRNVPAYALETKPGDLLLFNMNCKHASFGGSTRRRMFTINFSQRYRDEDLELLRSAIAGESRFWIDRLYREELVQSAGPERRRHLEQGLANDYHLAELSRQARERMAEPSRG